MKYSDKRLSEYINIATEWDYERNEKSPEDYSFGSNKYAYWICPKCGYHYESRIANKTVLGRGCPCCANKTVVVGINDLCTTHPEVASEWDHEKNGNLKPEMVTHGSGKKVWWRCPNCAQSYQATVLHRTYKDGTKCPFCNSGRQTSFAEQAVFYYVKKIYPDAISRYKDINAFGRFELDIFIPSINLAIEYDGEAWHKTDKHDREIRKYEKCRENGIKLIRLKEKINHDSDAGTADFILSIEGAMYEYPQLEKVIHQLLDILDPESNMWTRTNPLQYHSTIDVNLKRDEKAIRRYMTLVKGSIGEKYPRLATEWHPTLNGNVTPDKVKPNSDIKYWWLCPVCGYEYEASPGHRVAGTGCVKCGREKTAEAHRKKVAMIDPQTEDVIQIFDSVTEAASYSGATVANIVSVCKNDRRRHKAAGYKWKYIE